MSLSPTHLVSMSSQAAYQRFLCDVVHLDVGPMDRCQQVTAVGILEGNQQRVS